MTSKTETRQDAQCASEPAPFDSWERLKLSVKDAETLTPEDVDRLAWLNANQPPPVPKEFEEMASRLDRIRLQDIYRTERDIITKALRHGEGDPAAARSKVKRLHRQNAAEYAFDEENTHLDICAYKQRGRAHRPHRLAQHLLTVAAAEHASLLTLYGGSGLGKTTSAVRALLCYRMRHPAGGQAITISGMKLSRLSPSARSEFVDMATRHTGPLLLDDIDKGGKGEGVSSALLEIIEAREGGTLTILTTNCTGQLLKKKLEKGYGDPIVNRLARGVCINFDPPVIDLHAERDGIIAAFARDEFIVGSCMLGKVIE